jgi:NADP-dependent 3-hydroxy acid dehydrogenase YdfG
VIAESLGGRIVVVSGASSGIGLTLAHIAAERGARPVMLARRADTLARAAAAIGDAAVPIVVDIADRAAVRAAFGEIEARFGYIDALVNAAGAMRYRLLADSSDEDIDAVFGANLMGPLNTIRAAIPLLRKAGGGDIVNIGSEVTEHYLAYASLYMSSKAGLSTLSQALTRELRADRIRVALVVVGFTKTGLPETIPDEDRAKAREAIMQSGYPDYSGSTPMDPRWVAEAALFPMTQPDGIHIDVIHARSFGAPNAERLEGLSPDHHARSQYARATGLE